MTTHVWWAGIMESIAGLRYERGQLEYLPGDSGLDVELGNFHWGGWRWSMKVAGRGRWIDRMTVNGRHRPGTCQMIPVGDATDQEVVITKTDRPPAGPVILSAGASPVTVTAAEAGVLAASLASPGFARLHFFSPTKPRVTVEGGEIELRWSEKRREGTATIVAAGELEIVIDCR